MVYGHDEVFFVLCYGIDFECVGFAYIGDEGMIAPPLYIGWNIVEERGAGVVIDGAGFSVYRFWGAYGLSPVCFADGLMAEAYAEYRDVYSEVAD